ncbi:uncharacterized protein LOC116192850 isoform X5 [Punica granatum]|uniref:Uncharacterized protein LOC116192850 isoform X5 n=1 Tax=Punica granatum TaxID=22663 RepID=A0A6P8C8K9_PUNGR|nr:uncharacterized protein LOC116192850 isoform X5 [Punica granatum]
MATVSNSLCSPPCRWRPATALARWSPPRPRTRGCSPPPSLSSAEHTLAQIENSGVIACLRASSPELAMEAACAALRAGISVLEIVVSTPSVFEVLQQLVRDYPAAVLGVYQVGTVLNAKDAQIAISAGARFLMSPAMVKGILADTLASEVLYIPGVMTPTEILSAYDAGAKIVKCWTGLSSFSSRRYQLHISNSEAFPSHSNGCLSRCYNRINGRIYCSWSISSCPIRSYFQ